MEPSSERFLRERNEGATVRKPERSSSSQTGRTHAGADAEMIVSLCRRALVRGNPGVPLVDDLRARGREQARQSRCARSSAQLRSRWRRTWT